MKLYCGNCFDGIKEQNLRANIAFTSPPYNRKRNDKYTNYDDTIDDYYAFLVDATNVLMDVCDKYVIMNLQANFYNKKDVYKYMGHFADKIQNVIVWEKSNPLPANGFNITNAYELFILIGNEPIKSNRTYTKNHITTAVNSATTTKLHKAVMKQEVADWFIETFTKSEDIVIDPFMGLGTTGISCQKYGRDFVGIEKDGQYFEIAKGRIQSVESEENK